MPFHCSITLHYITCESEEKQWDCENKTGEISSIPTSRTHIQYHVTVRYTTGDTTRGAKTLLGRNAHTTHGARHTADETTIKAGAHDMT